MTHPQLLLLPIPIGVIVWILVKMFWQRDDKTKARF
jgi:hypothetical protein